MSFLSVTAAAEELGISTRRVRQLLVSGRIRGQKIGGRWLIDLARLPASHVVSRPMSQRMAWAFVNLMSGYPATDLVPQELYRLRGKIARLSDAPDPVKVLRSWLMNRAARRELSAPASELVSLRNDERVIPSGLSHPHSRIVDPGIFEGYVSADDANDVLREHLLVDPEAGRQPNVIMHVTSRGVPCPGPAVLVAADLADHGGPRENGEAERILAELLQ